MSVEAGSERWADGGGSRWTLALQRGMLWVGLTPDPDWPPERRARSTLRLTLTALFLLACFAGVLVGGRVYEQQLAVEQQDAAHGYQIVGRVVSLHSRVAPRDGRATAVSGLVEWEDRDGQRHKRVFRLRPDQADARSVELWVDAQGQVSTTRHTRATTVSTAVRSGVALVVVSGIGLAIVYVMAADWVQGRRRPDDAQDDIDQEWARVEPRWRRQVL